MKSMFRNRQPILVIAAALIIGALVCGAFFFGIGNAHQFASFYPVKQDRTGPVVGELGGHAVSIPRPYADFLEYDGDSHWLERKSLFKSERTYASKISSFGFYIRYPEMEVLTDSNRQEMSQESIYTSKWLLVGVGSNAAYGSTGDTALEAHIASIQKERGIPYRYRLMSTAPYGLTGYAPIGVDESLRNRPNGTEYYDRNIYFHRTAEGKADAYIECNNSTHAAAPCIFRFNLLPHMRAHVSVSFRKALLPHWQHIQSSVSQIILGFRVDPALNDTNSK